jgi:hypothetical protein
MAARGDGSGVVMVVMVFQWESMVMLVTLSRANHLSHLSYSFMSRFVAQCAGAMCGFLQQFFFMSRSVWVLCVIPNKMSDFI